MSKFVIGNVVNPTLNMNEVFIDQDEKLVKEGFHSSTMSGIKNVLKKENTCVFAQVIIYENITTNPMKVFRVLSCVI